MTKSEIVSHLRHNGNVMNLCQRLGILKSKSGCMDAGCIEHRGKSGTELWVSRHVCWSPCAWGWPWLPPPGTWKPLDHQLAGLSSTGWLGTGRGWSPSPGYSSPSSSPLSLWLRIGVDATFKVTPGNFQQLLIINARIGGERRKRKIMKN